MHCQEQYPNKTPIDRLRAIIRIGPLITDTNKQRDRWTDGRMDGQTLPILLSPRFAVDNDVGQYVEMSTGACSLPNWEAIGFYWTILILIPFSF